MDAPKNLIGYAGVYFDVEDAASDFQVIKKAHSKSWIGTYDAALFQKNVEGKVKVLDIDATQRTTGAKAGAIVGAVLGVSFPPSILMSAGLGAAAGAGLGNLGKGFSKGDIKAVAERLEPGQSGILLIADETFDAGAQKLMKKAKKFAKQVVNAEAKDLKAALANV
jgi:uncharacterized membrane protein